MSRAMIFANGQIPDSGPARALIQPDDIIFAADGGARFALSLGIIPNAIIGDFDSLTPAEVNVFDDMGVHMLRFPPHKNETDLELAIAHAIRAGHSPIIIIGAYGGRFDQTLANVALLTDLNSIRADVRLDDGITEAFCIFERATLTGKAGDIVSLLPWGNPVEGVSTEGLLYPLSNEPLLPYRTRGISNQMTGESATINLRSGLLLCIHQRKA